MSEHNTDPQRPVLSLDDDTASAEPKRRGSQSVSKSQVVIVMSIVTTVAIGTWQVTDQTNQREIDGLRAQVTEERKERVDALAVHTSTLDDFRQAAHDRENDIRAEFLRSLAELTGTLDEQTDKYYELFLMTQRELCDFIGRGSNEAEGGGL